MSIIYFLREHGELTIEELLNLYDGSVSYAKMERSLQTLQEFDSIKSGLNKFGIMVYQLSDRMYDLPGVSNENNGLRKNISHNLN